MNSGFGGTGFGQTNAAGGFGQQAAGGFGQQAASGFGQQNAGAMGSFGQQTAGGFGQQATGGFGQQANAAGGFGQQATGGFGQQASAAGGFGQQNAGAVGGFGQQATGGFGQQPAAGGFGQQANAAGGFGQAAGRGTTGGFGAPATGGFGQQNAGAVGGFGQQAAGGFGQQPAAGGFGQQANAAGGFGQQPATGGFGQQANAAGGFGQAAGRGTTGGFGASTAGGFGQPAAGGFGQQASAAGGFGQAAGRGATGGFGAPATGGFGQQNAGAVGGFGQQAAGGFGQQANAAGGFGQAAGRGATGGFGAPATGGFGQSNVGAVGGFGQQTAGGFGQQSAAGGFGQAAGRGTTGGFGASTAGGFGQPAAGGFGQQANAAGGFGQAAGRGTTGGFGASTAGGFGQPAAGGFGQQASAAGGFGQQASAAGGFGQTGATGGFGQGTGRGVSFGASSGGFGQTGVGVAAGSGAVSSTNGMPFLNLPDFAEKPYGNVLLFAPDEEPKKVVKAASPAGVPSVTILSAAMSQYQQRMRIGIPAPDPNASLKQQSASFSVNDLSHVALRDLITAPRATLGLPDVENSTVSPKPVRAIMGTTPPSTPEIPAHVPFCSSVDYILDPPLNILQEFSVQQLQTVHDFSIYRRDGKCSVHFLEPVNLVRCDISEVVALRATGEVQFYPGVDVPPPPGQGIHVPARVKVHGVVGTTADELRERCHRDGFIFESYDPKTGTWVYATNIDANEDVDRIVEADDGFIPEIERISTYGESLEGAIHTPAQFDSSGWYPQGTPPPLQASMQPSVPPASHVRPVTPASLAQLPSRKTQTCMLPVRTREVILRGQGAIPIASDKSDATADFKLPYDLPNISEATPHGSKGGALVIKGQAKEEHAPVYLVKKRESKVYEMNGTLVSQSAMTSLGRSFRCGWSPTGNIIVPSFAWLRDGTEGRRVKEEVSGARVCIMNPFFAHSTSKHFLQSCAISLLRTICRYLRPVEGTCDKEKWFYFFTVNLCRQDSKVSLSSEKLHELITAIDGVRCERPSSLEVSTVRQTKTVLKLLDALYGLPEADKAENNAVTENRYLKQLRRRNLNTWLNDELSFMDTWTEDEVKMNSTQRLLFKLLCHKLKDARLIAKSSGYTELSRVVGICGDGNQFGGYVKIAAVKKMNEEPDTRDRVVALLSGAVEPFVSQPRYKRTGNGDVVALIPLSATWKQLLGVFSFYGCTPDTSAEEIINAFLDRLRAQPSRQENAYPPYADLVTTDMLRTARGKDYIVRGDELQDAALSILEGYTLGTAPAAVALHPHASSYCASDYLTPFLILLCVRSLRLERTQTYKDAETKVLLGFSATLEYPEDTWFWALLPLYMIEDLNGRAIAVESFLCRNAYRYRKSDGCRNNADFKSLVEVLKVNVSLLQPVEPPKDIPLDNPMNAPSLSTHISLHDALGKFGRGFCKE